VNKKTAARDKRTFSLSDEKSDELSVSQIAPCFCFFVGKTISTNKGQKYEGMKRVYLHRARATRTNAEKLHLVH